MDCKAARRLIPAFVDGELQPDMVALLDRHLASCPTCREEMAALQRTNEAMLVCGEIEPAFTLADIRERAARRSLSGENRVFAWLLPMQRFAASASVIIALAIGSLSGVYYCSRGSGHTHLPTTAAARGVSDSMGLDAFDDGLAGALFASAAGTQPSGGSTR